ncbi:hypothetical protein ACSBOB_16995 [Mesorhizobium sp. ASY16-5R]|uniref:hypothetical protein n=1 Tax=Mesorhizobium sp. ASY16-5R TaxID=3445772 RepID=UPI003FA06A56
MAETESYLSEDDLTEILVELVEMGARIAFDMTADEKIEYLDQTNISRAVAKTSNNMAVKMESFATDEPKLIVYRREVTWHQFSDREGDGHIRIRSYSVDANPERLIYLSIGYISFYTRANGEHISPHPNLIAVYKTISGIIKRKCKLIKRQDIRNIHVSKRIISSNDDFLNTIIMHGVVYLGHRRQ